MVGENRLLEIAHRCEFKYLLAGSGAPGGAFIQELRGWILGAPEQLVQEGASRIHWEGTCMHESVL